MSYSYGDAATLDDGRYRPPPPTAVEWRRRCGLADRTLCVLLAVLRHELSAELAQLP